MVTEPKQFGNLPEHGGEPVERYRRELAEADVVNTLRVGKQSKISLPVGGLDPTDFPERFLKGSAVVEGCSVMEAESVPRRHRNQFHMVGKTFPKEGEEFLEEERGGDDRRTRIVPVAIAFVHLCTTPKLPATVDQGDLVALGTQSQCRSDAAVSGAQNEGAPLGCPGVRDGHLASERVL